MSVETEIAETRQSIELGADELTGLRVYITERRIHYLAQSAVRTMRQGVQRYWNKHYILQSGQTRQLAMFQGGGDLTLQKAKRRYKGMETLEPSPNSSNFRSRNGNKRLVSFTFGKPVNTGAYQSSNLSIHSFPMNWYERDVVLGGWASGTIRKGTHIMKGLLPPIAQGELARTTAPMLADIDRKWNERGKA